MSNSQPDFRDNTKEYNLRTLVHSSYQQPAAVNNDGVGLKLVVETSRESRRRLLREKKLVKPRKTFDILTQLN